MSATEIIIAIFACIMVIAILLLIGLVICMITDRIDNLKIDKYMASCGFKKEIDHIYHLNNGEKYFYKFTRQYYDNGGNIAIQELNADSLYKLGYKEVKKKFIFN
ncbi:MAG: hypothetical protein DBY43_07770 [Clostridiaceae bacterium]|nr:MAG: hypothetical protein DBY43_07770 [Clostridiaceae bacterium]